MANNPNLKEGFYRVELFRSVWEIPCRYECLTPQDSGPYEREWLLCSAVDKTTNSKVSIKKLSRPFQSAVRAKETYRKICMLKHMQHENIEQLLDMFAPVETFEDFEEVYLVTDRMQADMRQVINTQQLTGGHVQFLIYQVLRALKYFRSAGLICKGLKTGNIAVNEECELKVIDFDYEWREWDDIPGYDYINVSAAPEVILKCMNPNLTADAWSAGCIMAEMLTGRCLLPGQDIIDQLQKILSLVGTPSDEVLEKICNNEAKRYIKNLPKSEMKDFSQVFEGANPEAINLLVRMFNFDPETRITVEDALRHPYFKEISDPSDEPTTDKFESSFEDKQYSITEWKKLIFEEVIKFKAPSETEEKCAVDGGNEVEEEKGPDTERKGKIKERGCE